MTTTIFVVDASSDERHGLAVTLAAEADEVRTFESAEEFLLQASTAMRGCVIAPSNLAGVRTLLGAIRTRQLRLPVVLLGRGADVATAVDLMRAGALEFLEPPISERRLRSVVRQAVER